MKNDIINSFTLSINKTSSLWIYQDIYLNKNIIKVVLELELKIVIPIDINTFLNNNI